MADADALIDRLQAAVATGGRSALEPELTSDVHWEDPFLPGPLAGLDELVEHLSRLWQAFPDARLETTGPRMHATGLVSAPVKLVATHRGEVGGIPASGRFVVVHGILVVALDASGARVHRVRAFMDRWDAARQIGMLPEPGTMGERALYAIRGLGLRKRG